MIFKGIFPAGQAFPQCEEMNVFLKCVKRLNLLIYNAFLLIYGGMIRLLAPVNPKARAWIEGRRSFPDLKPDRPSVWMHCASLGEFEQGRPLLEALRKQYPQYSYIVTFFSPSGYEIRKNYAGADHVAYLPLDSRAHARRWISQIQPALVVWVKYEYWHHYLHELRERQIPVLLVSALFRNTQPFFRWYGGFWRNMLNGFNQLFVQDESSASLLRAQHPGWPVSVAGDTRFDRVADFPSPAEPDDILPAFSDGKPLLVAGSTWSADETLLAQALASCRDLKAVIVPHEILPSRITALTSIFPDSILLSDWESRGADTSKRVLIIDRIGLLYRLYRYAAVVYIGGGFNPSGIHNTLEAAVYGKALAFGPQYRKFKEAVDLVECGAAVPVREAAELAPLLNAAIQQTDSWRNAGEEAARYVSAHRGAVDRILRYVAEKRLLTS